MTPPKHPTRFGDWNAKNRELVAETERRGGNPYRQKYLDAIADTKPVTRTRSRLHLGPNGSHILVRLAGQERHRRHVQHRSLETLPFQLTAAFCPTVFDNPLSQRLDGNDSHLSCGNYGNPRRLGPRRAPEEVAGCKEPVPVSEQGAYRYPLNRTCHNPEGTDKLDDVNALSTHHALARRRLREKVAKVMADGRRGKGDKKKSTFDSFDDAVKRLVAQGCSAGDIKVAYLNMSDREIEEAVAYAQHTI